MNGQIVAVDIARNRPASGDTWHLSYVVYVTGEDGETRVEVTRDEYNRICARLGRLVYQEGAYEVPEHPIEWADVMVDGRGL